MMKRKFLSYKLLAATTPLMETLFVNDGSAFYKRERQTKTERES
jgi:hypothetical protein